MTTKSKRSLLRKDFMHKDIREFIREIDTLKLPVKSEIFAGAGLIITADPNRYRKEHDIVVLSNEAESLSWFEFRMKAIFTNEIDYLNKYPFYGQIGTQLNKAQRLGLGAREQMKYVLHFLASARSEDKQVTFNQFLVEQ